jgi:hypothetical protein
MSQVWDHGYLGISGMGCGSSKSGTVDVSGLGLCKSQIWGRGCPRSGTVGVSGLGCGCPKS